MQILRPVSVVSTGNWSSNGSGLAADTSDGNDETYATAITTGGATMLKLQLAAGQTPTAGAKSLIIRCNDPSGNNPAGTLTVQVFEGGVLKQTSLVAAPLGSVMAPHEIPLTFTPASYSDLSVGVVASGTWNTTEESGPNLRVGDIALLIPDAAASSNTLTGFAPSLWAGLKKLP